MIPRYSRKEMESIWSPQNRFQKWLDIEILVCEALAGKGDIPRKALQTIKAKARFDVGRIDEIETVVKHDVIAFLTSVAEHVGPDSRFIHMGLTSSDILDTSLGLLLKEAADILLADVDRVLRTLKKKALKHKKTLMIGRTHGIHAEPVTFGLKMAMWHEEMARNRERLVRARAAVACGKISGAVGTFAFIDPSVEDYVCRKLGLTPEPVATQIVQRDRHAEFFSTLAVIASSLDKFTTEIRHLQRTEVREAEEYFSPGQKGSSAMPHKRNPVLSENLSGLARLMRGYALAAMENIALWHERDISHSSVERVIGPDATILLDFMLNRFARLVDELVVYPERMRENIALTRGVIFSQLVLLKLIDKGMTREQAYGVVQDNAMTAWQEGIEFKDLLLADGRVKSILQRGEIDDVFRLENFLVHVDHIYERVFGGKRGHAARKSRG
jgi:adenylosuccinate lyase